MRRYTVLLYPDTEEGGYTVVVPTLPSCVTQGETVEEALERAREVIALCILGLEDDGEEILDDTVPPIVASVEVAETKQTVGV